MIMHLDNKLITDFFVFNVPGLKTFATMNSTFDMERKNEIFKPRGKN
jgi:hypothetical protein